MPLPSHSKLSSCHLESSNEGLCSRDGLDMLDREINIHNTKGIPTKQAEESLCQESKLLHCRPTILRRHSLDDWSGRNGKIVSQHINESTSVLSSARSACPERSLTTASAVKPRQRKQTLPSINTSVIEKIVKPVLFGKNDTNSSTSVGTIPSCGETTSAVVRAIKPRTREQTSICFQQGVTRKRVPTVLSKIRERHPSVPLIATSMCTERELTMTSSMKHRVRKQALVSFPADPIEPSEESVLLQKSRKDSLMASSAMSTRIGRALAVTPPIEPTTRKDPAISVQSDLGRTRGEQVLSKAMETDWRAWTEISKGCGREITMNSAIKPRIRKQALSCRSDSSVKRGESLLSRNSRKDSFHLSNPMSTDVERPLSMIPPIGPSIEQDIAISVESNFYKRSSEPLLSNLMETDSRALIEISKGTEREIRMVSPMKPRIRKQALISFPVNPSETSGHNGNIRKDSLIASTTMSTCVEGALAMTPRIETLIPKEIRGSVQTIINQSSGESVLSMKETALAVPSTAMATCAGRNFPISETIHLRKRKQTFESLRSSVCEKRRKTVKLNPSETVSSILPTGVSACHEQVLSKRLGILPHQRKQTYTSIHSENTERWTLNSDSGSEVRSPATVNDGFQASYPISLAILSDGNHFYDSMSSTCGLSAELSTTTQTSCPSAEENFLKTFSREDHSPTHSSTSQLYLPVIQPTLEDCFSFERKAESGQLLFAWNSGLGRFLSSEFINYCEAECCSDILACTYTGSLLENIKTEIEDNLDVEQKGKLMKNFQNDFDINAKIMGCAACGMRQPQMGQIRYLRVRLEDLEMLQYSSDALAEFHNIPEEYREAISSYEPQGSLVRYHLHPELVDVQSEERITVMLCPPCQISLGNQKIPRFSIANGVDFGCPRRLGLPNLTLVEETLIARGVLLVSIIKLTGQTTSTRQWAKRGHTICFPQPSGVSLFLEHKRIEENFHHETYPRLKSVHDNISVSFIGLRRQWDAMVAAGNVQIPELSVRPEVVFRCLKALKNLNPLYREIQIDDSEEMSNCIERLPEHLFAHATVIEDEIDREIENMTVPDAATDSAPNEADSEPTMSNTSIPSSLLCPTASFQSDKLDSNRLAFQSLHNAMSTKQRNVHQEIEQNISEIPDLNTEQSTFQSCEQRDAEQSNSGSQNPFQGSTTETDLESELEFQSTKPSPLAVPHGEQPINEFRNNDHLLYSCFPLLFLLGKGLLSSGPLKLEAKRHMLLQYDNRHGACTRLNFLLFNQDQRHQTALATACYIKSRTESTALFAKWARDPTFLHQLQEAQQNPSGPGALKLLKEITPHVRTVASKIPYSAGQRKSVVSKLYAMTYHHGLPNFFITFAPDDIHGLLNIRLSIPQTSNIGFPKDGEGLAESLNANEVAFRSVPVGDSALRHLLTQGYIAGAETFRLMSDAIFNHLLSTPPETLSKRITPLPQRERGIFGVPVASFGVTEEQARGSLHMHILYWGGLSTWLLQSAAGIPTLMDAIAKSIDQVIQCSLDPEHHIGNLLNLQSGTTTTYHPVTIQMVNPDVNRQVFEQQVHDVISHSNVHQHTGTCKKGKTGDEICRVARPQPLIDRTKCTQIDPDGNAEPPEHPYCVLLNIRAPAVETRRQRQLHILPVPLRDNRTIIWEMERPTILPLESSHIGTHNRLRVSRSLQERFDSLNTDQQAAINSRLVGRNGLVVEYNNILSACLGCNTNVSLLGSDMQAKAGSVYVIKYISKAIAPITQSVAIIRNARNKMDRYPSVAEDAEATQRTGQLFLTRLVNEISGMIEVSAMMAAASNLGMPAETSSCRFFYVFVGSAIKYFQEHQDSTFAKDKREAFGTGDQTASDAQNSSNNQSSASNSDTEVTQPALGQLESEPDFLNNEEAQYEEGVDNDFATDQIFKSDDGPVPVPQHIHYAYRGVELAKYSLYEYAGIVDVIKKNPQAVQEENVIRSGRPANKTFPFAANHPLYKTHVQRLRSKTAVPIAWPRPPNPPQEMPTPLTPNWEKTAFQFLSYILTLFRPWTMQCNDNGTLPGRLTWQDFCSFIHECEFGEPGSSPTALGLIRFRWIRNMAHGMRVTAAERKAGQAYRFRAATRWGHPDCSAPFSRITATTERDNGDDEDEAEDNQDNDLAREAEAAIEALRDEADTIEANCPVVNEKEEAFLQAAVDALSAILKSSTPSKAATHDDSNNLMRAARSLVHHGIDREEHEQEQLSILKQVENDVENDCLPLNNVERHPSTPTCLPEVEDRRLNDEQLLVIRQVQRFIEDRSEYDAGKARQPTPPWLLLHGGPGTGKSFVVKTLVKKAETAGYSFACMAPTGIAATNLPDGRTIHSSFGFTLDLHSNKFQAALTTDGLNRIRLRLKTNTLLGIIVDEVSNMHAETLGQIDNRLQQVMATTSPFGGLAVILLGDSFQLPPVGASDSIFGSIVKLADPSQQYKIRQTGPDIRGRHLFAQFKKIQFDQQMRCTNEDHNRMLEQLRHQTNSEVRVDLDYIRQLKTLNSDDLKTNDSWFSALLVVNGNKQRYLTNALRSISWAQHHSTPRFTWRIPLSGPIASRLDQATQEQLYEKYPQFTGIFVAGAPAYLTENINPTRGLSNGTAVTFDSLTLHPDEDIHQLVEQLHENNTSNHVQLQFSPTYIHVAVPNSKPSNFVGIAKDDGRVILPIKLKKQSDKHEVVLTGYSTRQRVSIRPHAVDMGFAITVHKVQGQTCNNLILDLNPSPCRPSMSFSGLYVALSRVRDPDHLRVMPLYQTTSDLRHLRLLQPPPILTAWQAGYDNNGSWIPEQARRNWQRL